MDAKDKIKVIKSSSVFKGLKETEIKKLMQNTHELKFSSKATIIDQSENKSSVYLISKGLVRVFRISEKGEEITFAILGPGEIIGELSFLNKEGRSASAQTLSETEVIVFKKGDFEKIFSIHPFVTEKMLEILSKRLAGTNDLFEDAVSRTLKERVFKALTLLAPLFPKREIRLSQEELATVVGATRPRVTEVLKDFAGQGLIFLSRRKIRVLSKLCSPKN